MHDSNEEIDSSRTDGQPLASTRCRPPIDWTARAIQMVRTVI